MQSVKITLLLPDDAKSIKITTTRLTGEKVELEINITDKLRTCQYCGCKYLSMTKLSKYCSEVCKGKATKSRNERGI